MSKYAAILDDRHELLNLYLSQCARCKHFDNYTCAAFPDGIPEKLLTGEQKHDKIIPGQTGSTVFEEIKDSSGF